MFFNHCSFFVELSHHRMKKDSKLNLKVFNLTLKKKKKTPQTVCEQWEEKATGRCAVAYLSQGQLH